MMGKQGPAASPAKAPNRVAKNRWLKIVAITIAVSFALAVVVGILNCQFGWWSFDPKI